MGKLNWLFVRTSIVFLSLTACTEAGPAALAERYFEPYPDRITAMQTLSEDLVEFMDHYNNAKYKQTIEAYASLTGDFAQMDLIRIYVANAHFEMGNAAAAIKILSALPLENSLYKAPIEWYLSLAYLKLGETSKAKPLLEGLSSAGGDYTNYARELLDAIH